MEFRLPIIIGLAGLSLSTIVQAQIPVWTFAPVAGFPPQINITATGNATIQYTVTNQSRKGHLLRMRPIPGITASGCSTTLDDHESCILTLTVDGNALTGNIVNGPVLCDHNNPNMCYSPSSADALNIIVDGASAISRVAVATAYQLGNPIHYQQSSSIPLTYVSADEGKNWKLSKVQPVPQGGISFLYSVTCDITGLNCVTVGGYDGNATTLPLSYTSTDGGQTWATASIAPQNSGAHNLYTVTCGDGGMQCVTVGVSSSVEQQPLSYSSDNGGKTWSASSPIPLPSSVTEGRFTSTSCDSTGLICVSVGSYSDTNINGEAPLSYTSTNGGQTWTLSPVLPPFQGQETNLLNGVSCSSSGLICVAVGYYNDTNGDNFPIAYTSENGGKTWVTSLPPVMGSSGRLTSVSCDRAGLNCVAVGLYRVTPTSSDIAISYSSSDSGKNWKFSTAFVPPTLAPFYNVSCKGTTCLTATFPDLGEGESSPYFSEDQGKNWSISMIEPYSETFAVLFTSLY